MLESQYSNSDSAWYLNFQNWVRKVYKVKPDQLTELPIETYKRYWAEYLKELKEEQAKPVPKEKKRVQSPEPNTFGLTTIRRNFGNGFVK